MYPIEKRIPNLLTFINLFCGFLAIIACISGDLVMAGWLIFIAAFADLLDGLAARLLNAYSTLGGELDSLADMVSFGLAPALIAYMLLLKTHASWLDWIYIYEVPLLGLFPFAIVAAAAYRLARFNIAEESKSSFTGLPSPAAAMFFASLPLMLQYEVFVIRFDIYSISLFVLNPWILTCAIFLVSWLMISKIQLFSLKISGFNTPQARIVVLFLLLSLILFIFLLWASIPLIILSYILISVFSKSNQDEIQSTD